MSGEASGIRCRAHISVGCCLCRGTELLLQREQSQFSRIDVIHACGLVSFVTAADMAVTAVVVLVYIVSVVLVVSSLLLFLLSSFRSHRLRRLCSCRYCGRDIYLTASITHAELYQHRHNNVGSSICEFGCLVHLQKWEQLSITASAAV